jgi:RND family efflux transporter MFP subunit
MKLRKPSPAALKPAIAAIGLIGMIIYAGGYLHDKVGPEPLDTNAGLSIPPNARLLKVGEVTHPASVDLVGSVASDRRIQISSRMSAYVEEVLASAGDRVTNGQWLVRLDERELREQLAAAEAQGNQALTEFRRTQQLFQRNAATEQALTAAEAAYQSARAQVDRIKVTLSYARVRAPIDGVVTERKVEAGDLANPGQLLLTMFDPLNMRLEVPVPVRLTDRFAIGQEFTAVLDHPARPFPAVVTEIVGEIDAQSRTRRVKLRLAQTEGDILPGAFGRIRLTLDAPPSLFIPQEAVIRIGQLDQVHLVRDGRMVNRLVQLGRRIGEDVEVLAGLRADDMIVLPGATAE